MARARAVHILYLSCVIRGRMDRDWYGVSSGGQSKDESYDERHRHNSPVDERTKHAPV